MAKANLGAKPKAVRVEPRHAQGTGANIDPEPARPGKIGQNRQNQAARTRAQIQHARGLVLVSGQYGIDQNFAIGARV